jgi:hypothetical protein
MVERILKDATQLGSSLAAFANRQLETMVKELGPMREGDEQPGDGRPGLPLGQLASNVMQIVNLTGSLLVQLSKYDLVRQDSSVMLLDSGNALSSITVRADQEIVYPVLVENNGKQPRLLTVEAKFSNDGAWGRVADLELDVSERRRISLRFEPQPPGKHNLIIRAQVPPAEEHGAPVTIARKTVAVTVLRDADQHRP